MANQDPPFDFEAESKKPVTPSGGGPMQISAKALMKNFVFATFQLPDDMVEETSGKNGHTTRKLKAPTSGTYVLGAIDGVIQWIETEAC